VVRLIDLVPPQTVDFQQVFYGKGQLLWGPFGTIKGLYGDKHTDSLSTPQHSVTTRPEDSSEIRALV
jgi:hypothetical protein